MALGAASSVPAPRLVEASSVTVHTCLLASLCCFGFDLKIVNMVEEFLVELISVLQFSINIFLRERPLMTSDFRVGRAVQNDPKNRTF